MQNVCWNMFVKMRRRADLIMWRPIPGETVDERTSFMGFVDMYRNLEFKICGETEDKFLMRRELKGNR